LTLGQLSQLLWAAYGVTADKYGIGLKTAPSAGALYPLDVYAVVGKDRQEGLEAGVYAYNPSRHALSLSKSGDLRKGLARAALGQMWMAQAPVIMLISGEYARSTAKYGQRGVMYTHMESGFVGQNLFLQAGALGLRAGVVGAFDNRAVASTLGLPSRHDPLLAMPVGYGA
jgi:SagB-type dehydrogenase family enzyme